MIIDRYFPLWGGTENQLRQMVQHLKQKNCRILILTRRWDGKLAQKDIVDGIEVRRVGRPGRSFSATLSYITHLFLILLKKRRDYDIIHTNGAAALGTLGSIFARVLRKKNVTRISSAGRIPELAKKVFGTPAVFFLRKSDSIISLSKAIDNELQTIRFSTEKICRISNGVDATRFRPYSRTERKKWRKSQNLPENCLLVIYASLFKPGKGHTTLLQAWSFLEKDFPDAWLILLGGGNYQLPGTTREIMEAAESLKLSRVIFAGETSDTAQFTGIADVCAFPAEDDSEGCPNTLLEAMAAQLAPVAFNTNGVRDLIVDNVSGLLINERTDRAFAEGLNRVLRSAELREQLSGAARQYIASNHDFNTIAGEYMQLYRQLLRED
jgi:glycosyltransferase involved in cell wall biosynthesis